MGLSRTGFTPIPPGARPGFDHADVYRDSSGVRRLYVAHTGASRADVIDCITNSYLRSRPDHPGVAGILIDAGQDLLFTSDRDAARVSVYRCSDEQLLSRVQVGAHPNGLAYDPVRRLLLSFNLGEPVGENYTASVIDLDTSQVVATIGLPGRPRWAAYDADDSAVEQHVPAIALEAGQAIDQRRLAGSIRPDQAHRLTALRAEPGQAHLGEGKLAGIAGRSRNACRCCPRGMGGFPDARLTLLGVHGAAAASRHTPRVAAQSEPADLPLLRARSPQPWRE